MFSKPNKPRWRSKSHSFILGKLLIEHLTSQCCRHLKVDVFICSLSHHRVGWLLLFSSVRSCCRGGRAKPGRLLWTSCGAAKETKGRCGGEVRQPTVRGVLCCVISRKTRHLFFMFTGVNMLSVNDTQRVCLIFQAKHWLPNGWWPQQVHGHLVFVYTYLKEQWHRF